jgi:hypothetical protein
MSKIRTLMMIAVLTAGIAACRDKPTEKAATDKPAAAETPAGAVAPAPGAGAPSGKPGVIELVPQADAERFYTFIEQLVTIAVANQDDCTKLAAAINAHIDANMTLINDAAAMNKQHKEMPPAIKDKMAKKFFAELGPAVTKKCAKDKGVMAAFTKIRSR